MKTKLFSAFPCKLFFYLLGILFVPKLLFSQQEIERPYLKILGTVQDGGSPHIGCEKMCCKFLSIEQKKQRKVTSLAVIYPQTNSSLLFEATPDIILQWKKLNGTSPSIFLTHAHMGHYSGLMNLGREALGAKSIPVYAMPKMSAFLNENGPWSQLVTNKNISLTQIEKEQSISLTPNLMVTPFLVPHRDEYTETVGYRIKGPNKTALFIPDIDKWSKWEKDIIKEIEKVDYAFIDGTFYSGAEINNRDISEIPHPFIQESMDAFKDLEPHQKNKIYFIHFNHTNPVLDPNSKASKRILKKGFHIARKHDRFSL